MIYNNFILLITKLINVLLYKNIRILSKILLDSFLTDFVIIKKIKFIISLLLINNQIYYIN